MANPNVFAQFAQPVRSVADYMDQFDQQDARKAALEGQRASIEGQRQQNALTALALRQRTEADARTVESQNAIRRVAAGARTPEDLISGLRATGLPEAFTQADAIEKGLYERKKADAAAGKDVAETQGKQFQNARDKQSAAVRDIAMFSTPQDAIASMNAAVSRGDIPMQAASLIQRTIPQSSGPEFDQWKLRLIVGLNDPAKMAELMKPVLQTRNTGGSTDTLAVDPLTGAVKVTNTVKNTQSPDSVATTLLGYAKLAEDRRHNTTTEGQASGAVTYQQDADGNFFALPTRAAPGTVVRGMPVVAGAGMQPMKGGGKGGTADERNAAGYASRMVEATKLLDQFEPTGKPTLGTTAAGAIPFVGGMAQRIASTDDQGRYRQAQEDWVRAKLRKESGAAIGADEMSREIATYFPQVGDSPAVVAQKRQARAVANEAMRKSAGTAAYSSSAASGTSGIDDIMKQADAILKGK